MPLFDMNVKTPSHEKVVLSGGKTVYIDPLNTSTLRISANGSNNLDENDAIRLAAFLSRWYRERNRAEITAMKAEVEASRAAKKDRYEKRRGERNG
jgi:hypothetical protein